MANDNLMIALKQIRRAGKLVRNDLAHEMDISLSLASKITAELIQTGLVCEVGRTGREAGRPSDLLSLNPQAGYAVGLDIGGDQQVAVITNLTGEVVASLIEPPQLSSDRKEVIANLTSLIERLVVKANLVGQPLLGVGVGARMTVDPVTGITYGWSDMGEWHSVWANFPLGQELAKTLPYPHILVDDIVRALGVAEAHYGQGQSEEVFICILVDNGIGMSFMLNGVPYIGFSHIACEIGHIPIPGHDVACACGNTGCLEKLASTPSILARLQLRLEESQVRSNLRSSDKSLDINKVIQASEEGDKLAFQLLTEAGDEFGQALAIVLNLFGPRLVVVGGAMSHSGIFLDAARRMVRLRALEQAARVAVIEPSRLDPSAGARGAATLVLNALFNSKDQNLIRLLANRRS